MTHNIKLDIAYADAVLSGEKSFELRFNDRCYQRGDFVTFKTVRNGEHVAHPVERLVWEITFVLNGYGLKEGWCVFGIHRRANDTQPEPYPWEVFEVPCGRGGHDISVEVTPSERVDQR